MKTQSRFGMVKISQEVNASMYSNDREDEAKFLKRKYPHHQPCFVRYKGKISRHLLPNEQLYSFLLFTIRKSRQINPTVAVMSLIEKSDGTSIAPSGASTIGELADKYKHNDGFCYIEFVNENVFG